MQQAFRPMLAIDAPPTGVAFPVYASAKLDGVRCLIRGGRVLGRSLKSIPNKFIQRVLSLPELEGLDGELIVGSPSTPDTFRRTMSGVMCEHFEPAFTFYVFEKFDSTAPTFAERLAELSAIVDEFNSANDRAHDRTRPSGLVRALDQILVRDQPQLEQVEDIALRTGFEGLILRAPASPYKLGRSTVAEGYMLKVKRFADDEAVIVAVEEMLANQNPAGVNELGRTHRSTARAGLVGKGTMGALRVRRRDGVEFNVGSGFDDETRAWYWQNRANVPGLFLKYRYFAGGGYEQAPRFPVACGLRNPVDM
jgi:DNA ligase-1